MRSNIESVGRIADFYDNWQIADFRKLVLTAIVWTTHVDVPPGGVEAPYLDRDEIMAALAPGEDAAVRAALPEFVDLPAARTSELTPANGAKSRNGKIRAFDKDTGAELWSENLPWGGYAPPATEVNERQYIVIPAPGRQTRRANRRCICLIRASPEALSSRAPSRAARS